MTGLPALLALATPVHAGLVALAAPALDGLLRRASARWRCRSLPPVWQSAHDLVRLWRKPGLVPADASFVFAGAPALSLGAAATASLTVPSFAVDTAIGGGDLLAVAGLLALSRLAPALAAYDVGTARGAFDGGRAMTARLPATPVLLLAALVLSALTGGTDLSAAPVHEGAAAWRLPGLLAGLVLVAWAATDRPAPPIYSGRHLALVAAAFQLRRVATLSAAAAVGLPFGLAGSGAGIDAWLIGMCCWVMKVALLGLVAGALDNCRGVLPGAALVALIGAVIAGVQGRA